MRNKILTIATAIFIIAGFACSSESGITRRNHPPGNIKITRTELINKIRGGWPDRVVKLPVDFRTRRDELYWYNEIPQGDHTATLKWQNPRKDAAIEIRGYIEFTNTRHDELEYRAVK